jgi:hypothetical protein
MADDTKKPADEAAPGRRNPPRTSARAAPAAAAARRRVPPTAAAPAPSRPSWRRRSPAPIAQPVCATFGGVVSEPPAGIGPHRAGPGVHGASISDAARRTRSPGATGPTSSKASAARHPVRRRRQRLSGGRAATTPSTRSGADTAVFSGTSAQYSVTKNQDGSFNGRRNRTNAPDGTDRLTNVEVLKIHGHARNDRELRAASSTRDPQPRRRRQPQHAPAATATTRSGATGARSARQGRGASTRQSIPGKANNYLVFINGNGTWTVRDLRWAAALTGPIRSRTSRSFSSRQDGGDRTSVGASRR